MQNYKEIEECAGTPNDEIIILDTISQGAMFRVLKARRGTKLVALKVANTPSAMFTELLRREYELGCTLSHGCVVTTLGFEEHTEAGAAIVMEYVEGVTLDEFIAPQPSRFARERVLRDILDGVEYLHHRGILHNDLKPQNIIVNQYGAARIIDFGLSAGDDSLWNSCVGGSHGFSAPEIVEGHGPVGAMSDIYSVGMLVEYIFEGKHYGRIVKRAKEFVPEGRYDSISALRRALVARRRMPQMIASVVAAVASLAALLTPHFQTFHKENKHATYGAESAAVLNEYYDTMMSEVEANRYTEFAAMARGLYMLRFQTYRSTLPTERHLAAEELFAEHVRLFDSVIVALPSINSLPAPQRDSLTVVLDKIFVQYNK